jgi:hypothetical protein
LGADEKRMRAKATIMDSIDNGLALIRADGCCPRKTSVIRSIGTRF